MQLYILEQKMRSVIIRHNAIIDLTRFFRDRYTIITLAHFVSAAMVIGFSMVNLLTLGNNGLGAMLYVAYTVAALSQLLVYCYGGTLVAESVSSAIDSIDPYEFQNPLSIEHWSVPSHVLQSVAAF